MMEDVEKVKVTDVVEEVQTTLTSNDRYPVPSNDPNDPLNWSSGAKATTYGTICCFSWIANVSASCFTIAVPTLSHYFNVDTTRAVSLTVFNVLMFGLGNVLWVPLMRVFGKRPVYLFALALFVVANAWSIRANSWGSLLGGRMLAGFASAAADATVPSVVTDLFFVDQRGHCMMFFHFALASGVFIGPLINAWVVQYHGWRWAPAWVDVVGGLTLVAAFFLIRETQYLPSRERNVADDVPTKRNYRAWLSLTIGYNNDQPWRHFCTALWDILCMTLYPPVLWCGCTVGVFVGCLIIIQTTSSQVFTAAPYRWQLGFVGVFCLAGWIGACSAFWFGGGLIDRIANKARKSQHILDAKPEQRLKALIIPALVGPVGLIVFGQCVAHRTSAIGPAFGYSMHAFGFVALSNIAITYAVDFYENFAAEALVSVFVVRNIVAVICSLYSGHWISENGLMVVTGTMAGITWTLLLVGIPLYFLNDRILRFTDKYGPQRRKKRITNATKVHREGSIDVPIERLTSQ